MDIIDRLKKERKIKSVFEVILKGMEEKAVQPDKPSDIEVRELDPAGPITDEGEVEENPVPAFRTAGMHEFDMESLATSSDTTLKIEYRLRVGSLIEEGRIDEAIEVLNELKSKLSESGPK
ncbi:hypothetical protein IBX73_02905 [candidate division WOR-3 bacterium]|nr:hypothetical protein [candidate division WOR-3 bacterium]